MIDTRTIQTNISVRDGETVVIGGLIQTRDDERRTKVPLLGDIPIIGAAFRSNQVSQTKTELLVILTPRVIRSGEAEAREAIRQLTEQEIERLSQPELLREATDGGWPKSRAGDLPAPTRPIKALDRKESAGPDPEPAPQAQPLRSPYALPEEEPGR